MGSDPSGGLLRQRGGTGTVSGNDQPFRGPRGSGRVGPADGAPLGAVGVHDGPAPVLPAYWPGRRRHHGAVFADPG